jgi:hypothetical protein
MNWPKVISSEIDLISEENEGFSQKFRRKKSMLLGERRCDVNKAGVPCRQDGFRFLED